MSLRRVAIGAADRFMRREQEMNVAAQGPAPGSAEDAMLRALGLADDSEDGEEEDDDAGPPEVYAVPSTGAQATPTSAVQLLNIYCQRRGAKDQCEP